MDKEKLVDVYNGLVKDEFRVELDSEVESLMDEINEARYNEESYIEIPSYKSRSNATVCWHF